MQNSLLSQLAELQGMSIDQLQIRWRELFDGEPKTQSRAYLIQRLSYRLQELTFKTDANVERRLEALARKGSGTHTSKQAIKPALGAKIIRQYKGVELQIAVLADGYEFQGRKYKSLTSLANEITGTNVSGPVFFGLSPTFGKKAKVA